jgi:hypothetical protein
MDKKEEYEAIFADIAFKKYRVKIDFRTIEKKLAHLRDGEAITYADLEVIAREDLWPFNRYWMWPAKEQIENGLEKTTDWIIDPAQKPEDEPRMLYDLTGLFKNIALVSILLRFVWPEHYAIYSRPSLKILRVERGEDDVEEYSNFNNEMRMLQTCFRLERTADVDMLIWAVTQAKDEFQDIKALINEQLPKELPLADLLRHASGCPIRVAEAYLAAGDEKASGYWAGRAFERILRKECIRLFGYVPKNSEREIGDLEYLIRCICDDEKKWDLQKKLFELKVLRNSAIHIEKPFNKRMAAEFIEGVKAVAAALNITC